MIDDATIKRVAAQCGIASVLKDDYPDELRALVRAIEQLARHEQREEDAWICEAVSYERSNQGNHIGFIAMHQCAEAIRAAGKESSNGC